MPRLVGDRFFEYDSRHVLDLATGQAITLEDVHRPEGPGPALAPLVEVLEQGREGMPRWLVAVTRSGVDALLLRIAADAARCGFVPVAVDVYARLGTLLEETLRDRSLVLLGKGRPPGTQARLTLIDAASRSPRPHLLLTIRSDQHHGASIVREARSVYGMKPPRPRPLPAIDSDVEHHLRRALRAAAFVEAGRHAAAERLLRDVAGALARRGRHVHAGRTMIELGAAILERGRVAEADRAFEDACAAGAAAGDEELIVHARLWQAAARADAGRLTESEAICRAVLSVAALENGPRARAHAALARVLLWQGRVPEALELDLSLPQPDGLDACTMATVRATEIRVLLAGERLFEAGLRVERLTSEVETGAPIPRVIAAGARLRWLLAAGDLDRAERSLTEIASLARQARAPLRAARAQVLWAAGLMRAGRSADARQVLRRLERICRAAPPLLKRPISELLRGSTAGGRRDRLQTAATTRYPVGSLVASMIGAAQDEDADRDAIVRVLEVASAGLGTSRVDVCSSDAGPTSILASVGTGLPTRLGERVLDTGVTLGPETVGAGSELGVPVRRGRRLIGAFVARWPADRTAAPGARELLETAAAVAGPRLEAMQGAARSAAQAVTAVPELIGVSTAIEEVRSAIARAASAPFAVMVQGESGVGKELVARAIHQLSPRRERRFCDINCAALPDDLLESELFGHARGAFTGAVSDRPGLFEDADGGTVFLDELADLSMRAQAKLLRVLQQQEVRRVGETFSRKVDVRLVTAANRDIAAEAESGRFRQDLLYRLDVIRIRIPPLRDRPEDVAILAQHFWQASAPRVGTTALLTHGVLAALARYHWPGNVRELQNVMAALAVAAPSRGYVRANLLPAAITGATLVVASRLADARAQFERRAIESALARAGGSRTRAARELGLSRQGLLKMMARLGLTTRSEGRVPDAAADATAS
ncbi:MAG TPA: sigma 54-interacting transcriptional regulator [Vicinamibacterales bacterium]|nr:sigma 54-interacting transcriptional regulator [Vicinamibacterales bacterium]